MHHSTMQLGKGERGGGPQPGTVGDEHDEVCDRPHLECQAQLHCPLTLTRTPGRRGLEQQQGWSLGCRLQLQQQLAAEQRGCGLLAQAGVVLVALFPPLHAHTSLHIRHSGSASTLSKACMAAATVRQDCEAVQTDTHM